jgi:cytochrome c oxidase subunit 2
LIAAGRIERTAAAACRPAWTKARARPIHDRSSLVQKLWSVLFGVVLLAELLLFLIAPLVGWWLPKNICTFGPDIDWLFYFILAVTGFFFILTEVLLVWFMYIYAGGPGARPHVFGHHAGETKVYWTTQFKTWFRPVSALVSDQHRLELTWTMVPAVILLIVAVTQIYAWDKIKYVRSMPDPDQVLEVSARQFEWRMRYPTSAQLDRLTGAWRANPQMTEQWARSPHADDIHVVNELHIWKGAKVRVYLKSRDVLHSFFLPNMRIKQDAVPGKVIPVWFQATEANTRPNGDRWEDGYDPATQRAGVREQVWELACAELCGWGHYKMQGKLYVHETKEDFDRWLQQAESQQRRREP